MGALGGVLSMTAPVPDCVVPLTCARSPCREVAHAHPHPVRRIQVGLSLLVLLVLALWIETSFVACSMLCSEVGSSTN